MDYDDRNWPWGTEPFFPVQLIRHAIVVSAVLALFVALVFFMPSLFSPCERPADPSVTPLNIKPEWYFLAAYQTLKLIPSQLFGSMAKPLGMLIPLLALLAFAAFPFLDRSPERDIRKRPFLLLGSIAVVLAVMAMTVWGFYS